MLASHSGTHNRADYIRLIPHCCKDPGKTGQTKLKTLDCFWERGGLLVLLFTAKLPKVEGRVEDNSLVAEASCLPLTPILANHQTPVGGNASPGTLLKLCLRPPQNYCCELEVFVWNKKTCFCPVRRSEGLFSWCRSMCHRQHPQHRQQRVLCAASPKGTYI